MLYITGDTHGDITKLRQIKEKIASISPDDILIIAGDFGFLFNTKDDDENLKYISNLDFTIAFVDGNHECFPKIYSYPVIDWNGGKVHRILPNLLHLMRGNVFTIEEKKIFVMGGGFSSDRSMRIKNSSWWEQELPSEEEYEYGLKNLSNHHYSVDAIISHAAPYETLYMLSRKGLINKYYEEELRLTNYLQYIAESASYDKYYFGHLHIDEELWRNQIALLNNVYCLNTGDFVTNISPKF